MRDETWTQVEELKELHVRHMRLAMEASQEWERAKARLGRLLDAEIAADRAKSKTIPTDPGAFKRWRDAKLRNEALKDPHLKDLTGSRQANTELALLYSDAIRTIIAYENELAKRGQ